MAHVSVFGDVISAIGYGSIDISLIKGFIIMKICIHVAEDCLQGSLSQNVDIGPSFYFMLCRSWNFRE